MSSIGKAEAGSSGKTVASAAKPQPVSLPEFVEVTSTEEWRSREEAYARFVQQPISPLFNGIRKAYQFVVFWMHLACTVADPGLRVALIATSELLSDDDVGRGRVFWLNVPPTATIEYNDQGRIVAVYLGDQALTAQAAKIVDAWSNRHFGVVWRGHEWSIGIRTFRLRSQTKQEKIVHYFNNGTATVKYASMPPAFDRIVIDLVTAIIANSGKHTKQEFPFASTVKTAYQKLHDFLLEPSITDEQRDILIAGLSSVLSGNIAYEGDEEVEEGQEPAFDPAPLKGHCLRLFQTLEVLAINSYTVDQLVNYVRAISNPSRLAIIFTCLGIKLPRTTGKWKAHAPKNNPLTTQDIGSVGPLHFVLTERQGATESAVRSFLKAPTRMVYSCPSAPCVLSRSDPSATSKKRKFVAKDQKTFEHDVIQARFYQAARHGVVHKDLDRGGADEKTQTISSSNSKTMKFLEI